MMLGAVVSLEWWFEMAVQWVNWTFAILPTPAAWQTGISAAISWATTTAVPLLSLVAWWIDQWVSWTLFSTLTAGLWDAWLIAWTIRLSIWVVRWLHGSK
jgi:hypothetical protein